MLALSTKLNIPTTSFDAIMSIGKRQQTMFDSINRMNEIFRKASSSSQINNLQFALTSISGRLSAIASFGNKWESIERYNEMAISVDDISAEIIDAGGLRVEHLAQMQEFLQRIEFRVDKIDADTQSLILKAMVIISFILSILREGRNWLPKPEYATKEHVELLLKENFARIETQLKKQNEFRTTNRIWKVMLKPNTRTLLVTLLPVNFDVIVLQGNKKWVYVSHNNPKDNLPQTGWVMKKHLN
jgi:hypothetical protein